MRFAVAVLLVEHEILHAQHTQLVQHAFLLRSVRILAAFGFGARQDFFEIRRNHQTSAFLINLRNTITEWSGGETAHVAVTESCRNALQLLQIRAGGKQIILNPNVEIFSLVVSVALSRNRRRRILDKLDLRPAFLIAARILRDFLFEELAETL